MSELVPVVAAGEVDVILPVLDEVAALGWVLRRIPAGYRAIVVDNGSTDGSGDLARSLGAVVVTEPRRGFGAACAAGLAAATAPLVAFCDADASLDPADLPEVVAPVRIGAADLVLGARRPVQRGAWPVHARLANAYLARRMRRWTGARLTDLGPMRAARRDALLALGMEDRRFGFPLEMVVRAGAASWRIAEVGVPYARRTGRSKVTGTVRGTARAVRDMRRVLRGLHCPFGPAASAPASGRRFGVVPASGSSEQPSGEPTGGLAVRPTCDSPADTPSPYGVDVVRDAQDAIQQRLGPHRASSVVNLVLTTSGLRRGTQIGSMFSEAHGDTRSSSSVPPGSHE